MKAEQLQLALRPRPMYEAADLGVRMAQDGFASLRRAYLPFGLLLVVACGSTIELAPWLPSLLLWWLKPWLDRALLHVYARQVFGEPTGFAEAWEARARAPWPQLLQLLTLGRLSPWRSYSMPVAQLEGQAGAARRRRLQAVLRSHRGPAMMTQAVFSWVEAFLMLGLVSLAGWLTPGLRSFASMEALFDGELVGTLLLYGAHAAAVLFVEPFYVAAGFAMYLNRRVELEAWDVEQDLRHAFEA
jgi:hypothetical protein